MPDSFVPTSFFAVATNAAAAVPVLFATEGEDVTKLPSLYCGTHFVQWIPLFWAVRYIKLPPLSNPPFLFKFSASSAGFNCINV